MVLRIKFTKYGPLKFIGHLDIMRYFQKAIRRADFDVKYSNGFSPHQLMSFAAPLSVGLESYGEYFDLEVNSVTSSQDMIERLNACMANGIEILSVKMMPEKGGNAMASVGAASYTVRFYDDKKPNFSLEEAVQRFMHQETVIVTKKSKKLETEIDIKPSVYRIQADDSNLEVSFMVDASSAGNIKPVTVMQALYQFYNMDITQSELKITRNDTLLTQETNFAPLDSMATVF